MDTELTCKYCNKKFSTIYNLKKHITTAKRCIDKRPDTVAVKQIIIPEFPCEYCGRIFTQKTHLHTHMGPCKIRSDGVKSQVTEQVTIKFTKKIAKISNELEKEKDTVLELELIVEKANERIRELELKLANKEGQIDVLKTVKPVINNINNGTAITYINPKLASIPTEGLPYLTQEYIQDLVKEGYTYDYFIEGPAGIAKFFSNCVTIPSEDEGENRFIFPCTDGSRHKYHKYETSGWKLDAGASFLGVAISTLKTIANEHYKVLTDKCNNDPDILTRQLLDKTRIELIAPMMLGINSKKGKRRDSLIAEVRSYLRPLVSI